MAKRKTKKSSLGFWKLIMLLMVIGFVASLFSNPDNRTKEPIQKHSPPNTPSIKTDEESYDFSFKKVTEQSGATSWIFEKYNKPPLKLSDKNEFVINVNAALDAVGLPKISHAVPELESLTGQRTDRGEFV